MTNIWATNGGVYYGYKANSLVAAEVVRGEELRYQRDRHIVTFGPNGSGKTRRLLVKNLHALTHWSMLVVDPKGELCRMTAAHRARFGKVIILNPFNLFEMGSNGHNPIKALNPQSDDFPDDALNLADAVIRVSPHDREAHFAQSAQDLMTALIMYCRLTFLEETDSGVEYRDNFGFVRYLLGKTSEQFKEIVSHMMDTAEEKDCEELLVKASRFYDIKPDSRELNSIISTALTQTRWLDSRPIKRDLDGDVIDFAAMKQRPTTIYLVLPARRIASQSPWLRLMIASMMQQLMADVSTPRTPTLLMLDEFAQLGHLAAIENNLAMMRGFGVKFWGIFQDMSQLKDLYPRRWDSFMANAGLATTFAPSDLDTSEYFSKRAGFTTVPVYSAGSTPQQQGVSTSMNLSVQKRELLLPQEIRAIDDGLMIAFDHTRKGTVRSIVPFYTEFPDMAKIAERDPTL